MRQRDIWPLGGLGPAVGSQPFLTRRTFFSQIGGGFGALGLAGVLADAGMLAPAIASPPNTVPNTEVSVLNHPLATRPPHFPARAKRVIFLFMTGGPSHVDTFDPKPALTRHHGESPPAKLVTGRPKAGKLMGSPFSARPRGQSGIEVSELFPQVAGCIDD